jgi:transcription antitermination factor NusG
MEQSLRQKVKRALEDEFVKDPEQGDRVELDDGPLEKVGGVVISTSFEHVPLSKRQDLVWDVLERVLDIHERARITLILADTPEEYRILKESA